MWNIIPKATKEQDELQLIDTDNGRVFQREKRKEIGKKRVKRVKYTLMEGYLTLGSERTMPYANDVLLNFVLEIDLILLIN